MTRRLPALLWLGVFIVLAILGASALDRIRHPSPPPINHCPGSDPANGWCPR